ncbi:hypothetical protein XENOCAPTIV_006859 [Xenoophorus captivus]|uniref:Uncharacterized protein n=1 Tax=Xenoophorus captivus TaxID=1517983 RepID=A0ABV0RV79_9TELE
MTLSVKQRGTHHFLIDSGERPLTPLSQMPSTCGFFVKRSCRDVQYAASYQGCHVNKREDVFYLPLRLWGKQMTMSCPDMLPLPSVSCFPNKMVVKIRSVAAKELKVKVSGTWQPLSSACSSCKLTFNESSGELTLIVPYIKDLCVEIEDEEYLLSLQWADFELSASCPPELLSSELKTGTSALSSDSDKVLHLLQYPQLPIFSQFLESQSTQSPWIVAPLPFSFVAEDFSENQKMPGNRSPALLLKFFEFPRPELPTHPSGDDNADINQLQLLQMPQSPQYQIPLFQEFPVFPGVFPPTTTLPLPATSTETVVTPPTPTGNEKLQLPLQPEFAVMLQYPFLPFPKYPESPQDQIVDDAESKPQQIHTQIFQYPMLYPPFNHVSQIHNAPAAATKAPPYERLSYQPHPYIPVYAVPKQAAIPVFLPSPSMTPFNPAPSVQQEHQPFYLAIKSFYPFLPDQSQTTLTNI